MTFWIGVSFLIFCVLGLPFARKLTHGSMLKALDWEGASVLPATWGLSGLRLQRARWEGEASFESASFGGGGRRGHLRLIASLKRPTPSLSFYEKGRRDDSAATEPAVPTGDAAFDAKVSVRGDAALAQKILGPAQRERLMKLQEAGGYLWGISGGVAELGGPLPANREDLKAFLDRCDALLDSMAGALAS